MKSVPGRVVVEHESSAVQFGESAGQREPDADALGVVAVLYEGFEYPAAVFARDDRAVVAGSRPRRCRPLCGLRPRYTIRRISGRCAAGC